MRDEDDANLSGLNYATIKNLLDLKLITGTKEKGIFKLTEKGETIKLEEPVYKKWGK